MHATEPGSDWYRDLALMSGDFFYTLRVEPDVAFEFISDNVENLMGYTAAEVLEDPGLLFRVVKPQDLPALQQALAQRSSVPRSLHLGWTAKAGENVVTQQWYRSRERADGTTVVEGTVRDVTTQMETQAALRESEERFRGAMQSSSIAMCLVSPAGQFQTVNQALCTLLGRSEQTLQTTTWQTLTHPDDLHTDVSLVDEILTGQRDSYRLLKRFIRPDGAVVWGDMSVSCVRDDGRVRYFITQIVDMTAHIETEHALRASEAQYRLLVEESSDFLLRTHADTGVIAWVAPAMTRVLGWDTAEVVGRSALEFLHPDHRSNAFDTRRRMDAGEQVSRRQRVLCKDGTYKWMSQVGRALFDDEGKQIGRISSFQDIDAQVRAEQALAESQAAAQADRERLRATMDAMLDPHFLISPVRDEHNRIIDFVHVDANDAGLAHAGFSREEFIGSRLLDLIPGQQAVIDRYIDVFESSQPMVEDAIPFANPAFPDDPDLVRLFDLRGIRVGEALSVTVRDVTAREEAARALAESQARYRLLAENASDIVYRMHIDGTLEWLSDGISNVTGEPASAFIGRHIDEFVHESDQDLIDAAAEQALVAGKASVRFRIIDDNEELRWLEATLHPVASEHGTILVGGCRDVHTEMQAMAELDRRARTDQLTGLPNRDEALNRLRQLLNTDQPDPVAVAFCDLDGFKTINDTYGHAVGDQWLRQAADRIRSRLQDSDLVARVGGDEILVVLPHVHTVQRADEVCEQLRRSLHDEQARSTVSIGVTLAHMGEDVDAVIARADQAMYQAKNSGRNRVVQT